MKRTWFNIALFYKAWGWNANVSTKRKRFWKGDTQVLAEQIYKKKDWKVVIVKGNTIVGSDIVNEANAKILVSEYIWSLSE